MLIKVDEDLPPIVAERLRQQGYDASKVATPRGLRSRR